MSFVQVFLESNHQLVKERAKATLIIVFHYWHHQKLGNNLMAKRFH
jgi:hypothetical protein